MSTRESISGSGTPPGRSRRPTHGGRQSAVRLPKHQLESIQEGDDDLNSNAPEDQEIGEEESDLERGSSHDSINDTERRTIHSHSQVAGPALNNSRGSVIPNRGVLKYNNMN
jgi:hypothetical protein